MRCQAPILAISAKIADYPKTGPCLRFNLGVAKKHMLLSRRILARNLVILGGLMALAAVPLWGLLRLHDRVRVAVDEYAELRLLERSALHVSAARGLMLAGADDPNAVATELLSAIRVLEQYARFQDIEKEGSASHEDLEHNLGDKSLAGLRSLHAAYAAASTGPQAGNRQAHAAAIGYILEDLNHLASEADTLVGKTQQSAARNVRNTIVAIAILAVVVTSAGLLISVRQYRDVVLPLRSLRDGVRTVASGSFSKRVPEIGDIEFLELARDFNTMAQELDGLYRCLEEKVEAKSRELVQSERLASVGFLAAGVAHEINNPLNIISGYAELSLRCLRRSRDGDGAADAQQSLQIIREEAFRCKGITEKLLSLSKPGDGVREPLSMRDAAEDVVQMLRQLKRYQDRHFVFRSQESADLTVCANESEIKQVLLNLMINAVEATESDLGEIRIEAARENGWVRLSVQDNGRGMTPEVCQQVFEPFFSSKRGQGASGVGLGLSISHAIVLSHAGRLTAQSAGPGQGSRFTLELPAHSGASQE